MENHPGVPNLEKAQQMLAEAEARNPGQWVQHSRFAAQAAQWFAGQHLSLDPDIACVCGLLHDIGRREGVTDLRHTLDGFITLLKWQAFLQLQREFEAAIGLPIYSLLPGVILNTLGFDPLKG